MKKTKFISYDGAELTCFVWDDVQNPKGVIQIIHGMTSHMQRYSELAEVWNGYGYIVFGDDHRPHGETAGLKNLGKASKHNFQENVLDEISITRMLKQKYNLPVQIFGHSYGSFLMQSYIEQENNLINGIILSGSAYMGRLKLLFGKILTSLQRISYHMDEPNMMMFKTTFIANNKPFLSEKLENAWLNRDPKMVERYNKDPYCNFYMSHGFYYSMMRGLGPAYKKSNMKKIRKDLPIFIISGSRDPLGGMGKKVERLYNVYKKTGLNVKMKLYEGARHELNSDIDKEVIIREMTDFFDKNI